MQFKPEVRDEGVSREIWYALGVAEVTRPIQPFVVTALRDGQHKEGSKHYFGFAVDLRTKDLYPTAKDEWFARLRAVLEPKGYDVLFEGRGQDWEHIHIEFDPKPNELFVKRL
jgi:hypothetical protein